MYGDLAMTYKSIIINNNINTLTQENIVVLKYSRKINSPEIIVGEDLNI